MLLIKVWADWLSETEISTLRETLALAAAAACLSKKAEVQVLFPKERGRTNRNTSALIEVIGPTYFNESADAILGKAVADLRPQLLDLTVQIFVTPSVSMGMYRAEHAKPLQEQAQTPELTSVTSGTESGAIVIQMLPDYYLATSHDLTNLWVTALDEREALLGSINLTDIEFRPFPIMGKWSRPFEAYKKILEGLQPDELMLGARFRESLEKNEAALQWLVSQNIKNVWFFGTAFEGRGDSRPHFDHLLYSKYRGRPTKWVSKLGWAGRGLSTFTNLYYPVLKLPPGNV